MHEHIGTALIGRDEAIALLGIEELDLAVLARATLDRGARTETALAAEAAAAFTILEPTTRTETTALATAEAAAIAAAEAATITAAEATVTAAAEAATITTAETTTVAAAEAAAITTAETAPVPTTAETAAITPTKSAITATETATVAATTAETTIPHSKSFRREPRPLATSFPGPIVPTLDLQGAYGQVRSMSAKEDARF
jgi:hypothetical protein